MKSIRESNCFYSHLTIIKKYKLTCYGAGTAVNKLSRSKDFNAFIAFFTTDIVKGCHLFNTFLSKYNPFVDEPKNNRFYEDSYGSPSLLPIFLTSAKCLTIVICIILQWQHLPG